MRLSENERLAALRRLLCDASLETSRLTAGAIGGHLAALTAGRPNVELEDTSDQLRDASLRLLRAIHGGEGEAEARDVALRSLDDLAAALRARRLEAHLPAPVRPGFLARLRLQPRSAAQPS